MNKIITLAVVSALFASSALAATHSNSGKAFVQLGGGYATSKAAGAGNLDIDSKGIKTKLNGGLVEGALGYNVNDYMSVSVNPMFIASMTGKKSNTATKVFNTKLRYTGGLVNARFTVPTNTMFKPFIMGGVGMMNVKAKDVADVKADKLQKSKSLVAFQGGAGVAIAISSNVDLEVGYKMLNTAKKSIKYTADSEDARKLGVVHNILGGVKYTF